MGNIGMNRLLADYLLPAALAALAIAVIIQQEHKAEEAEQPSPKVQVFKPRGPGPIKSWVRVAHYIERMEREKMPKAKGWRQ